MITEIQLNEMPNQFGRIWPSMSETMKQDQKIGDVVKQATELTERDLDNGDSEHKGFITE